MRKNKRKSNKIIYGVVIASLLVGISLLFLLLISKNKKSESQDKKLAGTVNYIENTNFIEEASSTEDKTVNEVNVENETKKSNKQKIALNTEGKTNSASKENTKNSNTINSNSKKKENKTEKKTKEAKSTEVKFERPVEGTIIKEFSGDKLLFSNTLNEWTTHMGIDIKSEKTSVVKAAFEGTVEAIKNDPRYGLTVIIKHDNGYKSVYSNLLTSEFVVEGEKVTTGQSIGTVGNTATFEVADESHLHFEIIKNGNQVDPAIYVNY